MTNLLEETKNVLEQHGLSFDDVEWVGFTDVDKEYFDEDEYQVEMCRCPKEKWENLLNVNYYSGFGLPEIKRNLVVVGDGWWLERAEYDGSEWWEFKKQPIKPMKELVCSVMTKWGGRTNEN